MYSSETSSLNITHSNLCFPILGVVTMGEGEREVGGWANRHFVSLRPRHEFPSTHVQDTQQCTAGPIQWLAWKFVFFML